MISFDDSITDRLMRPCSSVGFFSLLTGLIARQSMYQPLATNCTTKLKAHAALAPV